MLIPINKIRINEGRRELSPAGIDKLMESMAVVGLLNPISVDESNTLIAGNHRLEAAKRLGWTEIECSVHNLDGPEAELAEIDENFVRTPLTPMEQNDLLLRRKEIYEALHPETRAGAAQAAGMNRAVGNNVGAAVAPTSKSFVQDTAERLGVSPSTIKSQVRAAKNTVPEAKKIIRESGVVLSKKDAVRLSQLEPEQQKEAASRLASGTIRTIKEFCEDDSQPEAPRQRKRIDLDSISDEEFHILQGYERISKYPKSAEYGRQNPISERWNSEDQLVLWRTAWADVTNRFLERAGSQERVDHRSHAERGLDEQPTIHEGVAARALEQKGIISERCELNRQIKADNALLRELKSLVKKLMDAIKNTVSVIAEAMETVRQKMIIFRYQLLHIGAGKKHLSDTLLRFKPSGQTINGMRM